MNRTTAGQRVMCRQQHRIFPLFCGIGWSGRRLRAFHLLLFAALATGCASSDPVVRAQPQAAIAKPAITVLRSDSFRFDWDREISLVKVDLERCAREAIEGHFPELRYVSRAAFSRTAFPNLPGDAAPVELRNIRTLLDSPVFRERLQSMHLRYIVYVAGHTEVEGDHSWVEIGGYMAATFAGASSWKKDTTVSAVVLDLQNPMDTRGTEDHTTGTSWVAGLFPFIIGASASTEGRACRQIGEQLVGVLAEARKMETQQ